MTDPLEIVDLTHDGRGVGRSLDKGQGKTCFVQGALPGERVEWTLVKNHLKYDEGVVKSLLTSSPDRIEPKCRYFGECGGCQIQHLDYAAQVRAKQQRLQRALEHKNISVINWLEPVTSNPWSYRRRARLSVDPNAGVIGFKPSSSKQTLGIESCSVLIPELDQALPLLPDILKSLPLKLQGVVSEIKLSYENRRLSVSLLVDRKIPPSTIEGVSIDLIDCDLWVKFKNAPAQLIYSSAKEGAAISPTGFIQANAEINSALITNAQRLLNLTEKDFLLDLFCGSGNFSTALSSEAGEVVGIEVSREAVDRANSLCGSASNLSHRCADLFDAKALSGLRSLFRRATAVLLDPPRAGAEAVVRELVKSKPAQILYISCHPATFIRDAEILVSKGYKLDSGGLLDMFPQTMHAEVIGLFRI
ncbi:MAG: hypothetical protein HOL48_10725 [Porticoccaceae bacterium]|nr:hypothetical protein [Porticoccaceae bacterium]